MQRTLMCAAFLISAALAAALPVLAQGVGFAAEWRGPPGDAAASGRLPPLGAVAATRTASGRTGRLAVAAASVVAGEAGAPMAATETPADRNFRDRFAVGLMPEALRRDVVVLSSFRAPIDVAARMDRQTARRIGAAPAALD